MHLNQIMNNIFIDSNLISEDFLSLTNTEESLLKNIRSLKKYFNKKNILFQKIKTTPDNSFFILKEYLSIEEETKIYLCRDSLSIYNSGNIAKSSNDQNRSFALLISFRNINILYDIETSVIKISINKTDEEGLIKQTHLTIFNNKISISVFNNKTIIHVINYSHKLKRFLFIDLKSKDFKNVSVLDSSGDEIGYGFANHKIEMLYYDYSIAYFILSLYGKKKKTFTLEQIKNFNSIKASSGNKMKLLLKLLQEESLLQLEDKGYVLNQDIDYLDIIQLINLENKT